VQLLTLDVHPNNKRKRQMTTTKASRAVITLGDIQLDVFQLPDGKYFLSLTQVAESIDVPLKRMSRIRELKLAQTLYPEGFRMSPSVKVEDGTKPVQMISLDDVSKYWTVSACHYQNGTAMALLAASQAEALERRADKAFDVQRTEEEYNQRLVIRRDGIVSRFFWTDVIDEYIRTHEVSDNYRRFIYHHVSDMVNKAVLGMTAKQFRESQGLPDGITTRDYCTTEQLKQIDTIEKAAGMRVKRDDMCPKQALKDVISLIC
jgi:hypothetical protein